MKKEDFENLSSEQLKKKRKHGTILLIILFSAIILSVSITIYRQINGFDYDIASNTALIACLVIALPIYMGRKKIDTELRNREDK
jgi:Na+-transporting NADH:ubiquinone oxidoreductase subunit NqrD